MKITLISIVMLALFLAAANSRSIEEAREIFRAARDFVNSIING